MIEQAIICQEPGCTNPGLPCELPWVIGDPLGKEPEYEYYCTVHAHKQGYCYMCGHFWAGCESFDFDPTGLCSNCKSEQEAEYEEEMEELAEEIGL